MFFVWQRQVLTTGDWRTIEILFFLRQYILVIPQDAGFDLRFITILRLLIIRHRITMPKSYKDSS
jgi:hypothetical protein